MPSRPNSGYRLKHGEAVSIGIAAAAKLSMRMGLAGDDLVQSIRETLGCVGLPVAIPADVDWEKVIGLLSMDKKRVSGKPKFVLPLRIGEVGWGYEIEDLTWLR